MIFTTAKGVASRFYEACLSAILATASNDPESFCEDPPLLLNRAQSEILRGKGFTEPKSLLPSFFENIEDKNEITQEELMRDRCSDEHERTL